MSDFVNSASKEKQIINTWVDGKTNHLIPELLSDGTLDEDTKMVIVNTLYLKMKWQYPFKTASDHTFTQLNNNATTVKMMPFKDGIRLKYYENEHFQMVSLPYKKKTNDNYSMTIIRCKNEFTTVPNVQDFQEMMELQLVKVKMPKFTTDFSVELSDAYKKLGLTSIFNDTCDLSKMTTANNLKVNKIIHKAKIIVDEDGTEAASATAVTMVMKGMMKIKPTINFTADRAFQYSISHDESKTILFNGVYNG